MRFIKYSFVLSTYFLFIGFSQGTFASEEKPQIAVIAKNFHGHYSSVAKSLSLSSLSKDYKFNNSSIEDWLEKPQEATFIIALGIDALEQLNKTETKQPILAALITSFQWHNLKQKVEINDNISAIFYDPDIGRQLLLGKMLVPQASSTGILVASSLDATEFTDKWSNSKVGLELNLVKAANSLDVIQKYSQLADRTDFQLALPNHDIYNRVTIPKILLTSYRQNKPLIGYSIGMVKAGAIATTYTNAEMLLTDLIESIKLLAKENDSTFHRHSKYFDIKYNEGVAKALSIKMISLEQLIKKTQSIKDSAE